MAFDFRKGLRKIKSSFARYEIRELCCHNYEKNIYGVAYIPYSDEPLPLIIFSHELGNTYTSGIDYAKHLASHGFAVYLFDFCGGSYFGASDGNMSQMSVMTEVSDLAAILRAAASWDFVDPDRIFLMGASLGAVVSTIVSAQPSASVCGLIMLYPDLAVFDAIHKKFASLDEVPERFSYYGWFEAGRCYASDIWDYDLTHAMERCKEPVLIIHGDCDDFVDLSYAKDAVTHFPNAELKILPGAGHIFRGKDLTAALSLIEQYLNSYYII
jgi:dienelactone hydrolase